MKRCLPLVLALMLCPLGLVEAGKFEDSVRVRWRGAWVVLQLESWSTCSGVYYNNDVSGQYVTSRGGRKFEPGEMARVEKVQVKKKKAELLVRIKHSVLVPREDGPFTLLDRRTCAIELEVAVPREIIKAQDVEEVDRLLAQVAYRFSTETEALDSAHWNGREDDELPPDYDLTLARHAVWQAEQINMDIDARLAAALDEAESLASRIEDDHVYLDGFAAGTRAMRTWRERDCGPLLSGEFTTFRHGAPDAYEDNEVWCDGFYDGQRLVYDIYLLSRLPECYVEVPSAPQDLTAG
jgi:hypothetical protein